MRRMEKTETTTTAKASLYKSEPQIQTDNKNSSPLLKPASISPGKNSRIGNKISSMLTINLQSESETDCGGAITSNSSNNSSKSSIKQDSNENNNNSYDLPTEILVPSSIPVPLSYTTIKISLMIKKDKQMEMFSIPFKIDDKIMPKTIIIQAVDKFNKVFEIEKSKLRLSLNFANYKLKPSKKDGKPKMDWPFIDEDTPLGETRIYNFSLIFKPEDLQTVNSSFNCKKCVIF